MKFTILPFALFAATFFSFSTTEARSIDGRWTCHRHHVDVEVVRTSSGIKVLRDGQSRWYYYDRVGQNHYRDRRGNSYYLDNDQLEWRSYDRRNRLYFSKQGRTYRDRYDRSDRYHHNRNHRVYVRPSDLDGIWVDRSNCTLDVRARNRSIRVSGTSLLPRSFYPDSQGFVDKKGNTLRYSQGRIMLYNRRGRLKSVYRRAW